jgi:hypothetical protein
MDCPYLLRCPFYLSDIAEKPEFVTSGKAYYCVEHFTECARYRVWKSLGMGNVPENLQPYELRRADEIIDKKLS